ncbi:PRC-barrel domain containing protein [Qipengyuania sp. MTN3-11]|uniref:PRC-barrel domain containing protein n=1 Tax=Qipengyuania sp. MTN3-11 TaxID=3056557 RepID=UPI0036F202A4
MIQTKFVLLAAAVTALAACESQAEVQDDRAEDAMEMQAEQSAMASGTAEAALGMTEAQLLDADLVDATGNDLGDVELVRRDASGAVTGLVVELDDTDPDRWVEVPMTGLTARPDDGDDLDDIDVQTAMTPAELAALPDAEMPAPAM